MASLVAEIPAAPPAAARAHFESLLGYETDCWDVHESLGRPVKMMIGGITGWLDEGFSLAEGAP